MHHVCASVSNQYPYIQFLGVYKKGIYIQSYTLEIARSTYTTKIKQESNVITYVYEKKTYLQK